MARARILKPAFFSDVDLSEVSRDARLLYAGLWGLMDRRGLMEYHPKLVKRDLFPYDDDVTVARIAGWVRELVNIRRLEPIEYMEKRYLHCPHLTRHQQFHHNEKPNALIPDEVLAQGFAFNPAPSQVRNRIVEVGQSESSPGPAQVLPGACRTDTEAEAEAVPETETDAEAGSSRARESSPPPPHPDKADLEELGLTGLGDFLEDNPEDRVLHTMLQAYVKAYTLEGVRAAVPRVAAAWEASPQRRSDWAIAQKGGRMRFLRNWLENEAKDAKRAPRAGPGGPRDFDVRTLKLEGGDT